MRFYTYTICANEVKNINALQTVRVRVRVRSDRRHVRGKFNDIL